MGTGVGNLKAGCLFRLREAVAPQVRTMSVSSNLHENISLWEFVAIDGRPLMVVDKRIAVANRYDSAISAAIVYKNQSFDRVAAALDVCGFLRKILDASPASPLYLFGKTWGNYVLPGGDYFLITGDATHYNEALSWTPAEGWRPPENPASNYPCQYLRIDKRGAILWNPILDWTRKSLTTQVPDYYAELQAVNWKETAVGAMGSWSGSMRTGKYCMLLCPPMRSNEARTPDRLCE